MKIALTLALLVGPTAHALDTAGLRLNQIQVIGTHNSYKLPIEPALFRVLRTASEEVEALDYAHPPLSEQLDLGLRSLELDVVHDPEGGRYAEPRGFEMLRTLGVEPESYDSQGAMTRPGFKVLHVPDIDFRSNCPTLAGALGELCEWSAANPAHLPVVVTMNLKDSAAPFPKATQPVKFDAAALDALDAAIRDGLGEQRLVTPDLVRRDAQTLEAAVTGIGWPAVDALRGRFLWVLDEGGQKRAAYLEGHPSLEGRVLFTTSSPGQPESAVLIINDPQKRGEEIARRVRQGYLVRTRADSGTQEARRNDPSRRNAALQSGAQVVSTDYPRADKRFGTEYCVEIEPGVYARRNPITAE